MALHDPRPLDLNPDEEVGGGGSGSYSRFGSYLLFKQLKRDVLGEVYRAGQLGADAIERVVSLRLFNGAEIDGIAFRSACQDRDALRSILSGGPFGEIVDIGCENGVAYVAHEYVFGRSLAELLAQSRAKTYPVPLEHAVHLMDRIAIGLQNAHETRLGDKRITHGYLIPDFVHVSSEGEVTLTGFESTEGLLELDSFGPARMAFAGYISPEVNAGQPPTSADDVYSLGSIFGELLTGGPVPALNPAESDRWVQSAMLASEATPLPDNLRHILRESLLPRDQRIQNAEQWHRALVEATQAGGATSTTFDLAFYVHTLFGDELDREAELVKAEMQSEVPPPGSAVAAPPRAADPKPLPEPELAPVVSEPAPIEPEPAPIEVEPALEAEPEPVEVEPAAPPVADLSVPEDIEPPMADGEPETAQPAWPKTTESKAQSAPDDSPYRRWVAIGAMVLLALVAGGVFLYFGPMSLDRDDPAPLQVSAAPRLDPTTPAVDGADSDEAIDGISAVAPPLSPEELESQVRSLVAKRAGDLEANLKAEYDQRLVKLRQQLEEAKTTTDPEVSSVDGTEPAEEAAAPATATPKAQQPSSPAGSPAEAEPVATDPPPTPVRREQATPEPIQEQPATPAPQPERTPTVTRRAPVETEASAPESESTATEPGAIVQQGPGVTPPRLLRQPHVIYPPAAARLKRQATIRVRVLVDESGKPIEIEQLTEEVGLGFDRAALRAAKTTRWSVPEKNGVPVKMWVELSIDFRP